MKLFLEVIPHKRQRYDTVGDYVTRHGVTTFYISRMKDKRYVWLVFLHEVIEWGICRLTGVKSKEIDAFDMAYENNRPETLSTYAKLESNFPPRAPCGCKYQDEPGDDIHAPYHEAHVVASQCERIIAKALGVDWEKYDEAVMSL